MTSIPIPHNPRGMPASSYVSVSPQATLSSSPRNATSPPVGSFMGSLRNARQLQAFLPSAFPVDENEEGSATPRTGKMRVLLLENVSADAAQFLKNAGYEVSRGEMAPPSLQC